MNLKERNLFLDGLAIFFGISAWISINGVWVELPLLVQVLPESWALASYLSIIVQIANIGPISYSLLRWWFNDRRKNQSVAIYSVLVVGTIASACLATFWNRTSILFGSDRSTALFALVFFLSLVDCTSSVLFMPYMAIFRDIYLNSYLVGEGLSGFIPSIAALIQGVGGNPECRNVTVETNDSLNPFKIVTEKVIEAPNFSVDTFFYFLFVMMLISFVAFILMDLMPSLKKFHDTDDKKEIIQKSKDSEEENKMIEKEHSDKSAESEEARIQNSDPEVAEVSDKEFYILLAIQTFVCFVSNGLFPSIATYSSLPYGNIVYHLSATLNAMANPLMAFFAFFIPCRRINLILILTFIGSGFSGFLLATALHSPNMLLGPTVGGTLTVFSWVVYGGIFSYVKVSIAGRCRQRSTSSSLFYCGVVTQAGSAIGAFVAFVLGPIL